MPLILKYFHPIHIHNTILHSVSEIIFNTWTWLIHNSSSPSFWAFSYFPIYQTPSIANSIFSMTTSPPLLSSSEALISCPTKLSQTCRNIATVTYHKISQIYPRTLIFVHLIILKFGWAMLQSSSTLKNDQNECKLIWWILTQGTISI